MADADLLGRVCATYEGYLALGNQWSESSGACFVTSPDAPRIYDANHACRLRAGTPDAVEAVLAEAERRFAGLGYRRFHTDPLTPAAFEARLALEGFESESELELLLQGALRATAPAVRIRRAESDTDWEAIYRLNRLDHTEEEAADERLRGVYPEEVTRQIVGRRRAKGPALSTWLVEEDGVDCAFLSSWPGANGVGKVEDLFTHPDFRRRGIATALLVHGVADCRRRGALEVLIGARPQDTPKALYAALGFRPFCLVRGWLKRIDLDATGP